MGQFVSKIQGSTVRSFIDSTGEVDCGVTWINLATLDKTSGYIFEIILNVCTYHFTGPLKAAVGRSEDMFNTIGRNSIESGEM